MFGSVHEVGFAEVCPRPGNLTTVGRGTHCMARGITSGKRRSSPTPD